MHPSGTIHLPSLARCTANRFRKRHLPQMYHGQVCVAVCMIHFVGLRPTLGLGQSKLRYHSLRARWGLGQYWEQPYKQSHHHHHHHHISLNREGRWGNRWLHNQFAPFFPVLHCPLGLGELQACPFSYIVFPPLPLSALSSSPFHCAFVRWCWPDLMNGRHDHTTAICVSLRWLGGLHVVRLPAGSWHGLPRW